MKSLLLVVLCLLSLEAFAGKNKPNQEKQVFDITQFYRPTHQAAIVVTSFVPYYGRPRNNSQLAGNVLAERAEQFLGPNIGIYHCPLSVSTKAPREVQNCLAKVPVPVLMVLSLGESNDCRQKSLRLELGAKNYAKIWEYKNGNSGDFTTEWDGPISRGGPAYIPAKMPFENMYCGVMNPQSRLSIEFHSDPGEYICNFTQYQVSDILNRERPQVMHGFMHVLNYTCDKNGDSVYAASQSILEMLRAAFRNTAPDQACLNELSTKLVRPAIAQ